MGPYFHLLLQLLIIPHFSRVGKELETWEKLEYDCFDIVFNVETPDVWKLHYGFTYSRRSETRPWLLSVGPKLARGLQVSSQSLLLTV